MPHLNPATLTLLTRRGTWTVADIDFRADARCDVIVQRTPTSGEPRYLGYRWSDQLGWRQIPGTWYRLDKARPATESGTAYVSVEWQPLLALLDQTLLSDTYVSLDTTYANAAGGAQ